MKRYSDIINLRASKTAYNIQQEEKGEWDVFIPNEQFNAILKKIVDSVFNNNADAHKSFWLSGTYGTGKSHAAAVIKHLLCDSLENIDVYINEEFQDAKYAVLKSNLLKLREQKRLFPVTLYGLNSISHKDDLSLQLQRAISSALKSAEIDLNVKTDFDNFAAHVENDADFWDMLIKKSPDLKSVAPDRGKIISTLNSGNTNVLQLIKEALRKNKYHIPLDSANLCQWFYEVQDSLAKLGEYDGLLIIWDEFTDVMKSDIGISLLIALQELTEQGMNSDNNSYFLLISHPSAFDSLKEEERGKTKGRYHCMSYNMEPVSAFKIMSRKFQVKDGESSSIYASRSNSFFDKNSQLLDIFSKSSNSPDETKDDIRKLYPLHPSTANLATYYAREAGSSSRSVFEFLGDNQEVKDFFNSELHFSQKNTITADYLWNYVFDVFTSDIRKFGAVTERFNSRKQEVQNIGEDYFSVFKSILLLNALNNIANNETVTPSEENIINLFSGTAINSKISEILGYFNEHAIIQRAPGGLFSIQYTALPAAEIEDVKHQLKTSQFKYIHQVVKFDDTVKIEMAKLLEPIVRAKCIQLYSIDSNDYTLLNQISKGLSVAKPYEVFIALLFAKNSDELHKLKEISFKASSEERFSRVVFIVFESVFSDEKYERFIEYQANASCAEKHNMPEQKNAHTGNASKMLREWVQDIRRYNFTYYLREKDEPNIVSKISSIINDVVSPAIFSSGPESLCIIRTKPSKTCWKKASAKTTVGHIVSFNVKSEICNHCNAQAVHIPYLLQDSVDEDLHWLEGVDESHPLFAINAFIENKFKCTNKNTKFNLAGKLAELAHPPYGLYQTHAGMGMVAFAMRKYVKKIYDLNGKPRNLEHMAGDIVELFKSWENSSLTPSKLDFMFESKDAGELFRTLRDVFGLNNQKGYKNISSLTDARWAITHDFSKNAGYPLWVLKYVNASEGVNNLIDNVLSVCSDSGIRNPKLMTDTLGGFKKYEYELKNILFAQEKFENGFSAFIKSVERVEVQDDEITTVLDYIKKNTEGTIGLWTENGLKDILKNWRLEGLIFAPQAPKPVVAPAIESPIFPPSARNKKREDAVLKINAMNNLDEVKNLLLRLCTIESDELLDRINNHV